MTVYVQRDQSGKVKGVFANPQPGYAEEAVAGDAPEVVAYLAGPTDADLAPARRVSAKVLAAAKDDLFILVRAVLLVALDEINALRQRARAQDTAVANAASLADLKTRWAALAAVPDRTAAQSKAALLARIDTSDAE